MGSLFHPKVPKPPAPPTEAEVAQQQVVKQKQAQQVKVQALQEINQNQDKFVKPRTGLRI